MFMNMKLPLISLIIILSVAKNASSQRQVPERIYFTDVDGGYQAFDRVTPSGGTEVNVQKSVEVSTQVDNSYLQTLPPVNSGAVNQYNEAKVPDLFQTQRKLLNNQRTQQVQPTRPHPNMNTAPENATSLEGSNQSTFSGQTISPLPKPADASDFANVPVTRAVSTFGLNILRNVKSPSNVVVSPFSIVTLLALLQQGAEGLTQQQITAALQMTPDYAAGTFKTLYDDVQKRNSRNILRLANNVFIADAFDLNKAFKSVAVQRFASDVSPIKFYLSEAADKINQWVSLKTNNKIERLLAQDAVGENTQVVLVNAVYFKGLWAVKFRPESTKLREFHFSDGSKRSIPFMHMRGAFKTGYDVDSGAKVLILPFENEQYSLMVILPAPTSTVDGLLASLTDQRLIQYHTMNAKDVIIRLPKFTARTDLDLGPVLRKMGITNIFSRQAELFGIGTYRTQSPQVTTAVHSAMLSIDEEGGTAAAATAVSAVALSYDHDSSQIFDANRPFLTVLWDNQALLPLFMAKIENPIL